MVLLRAWFAMLGVGILHNEQITEHWLDDLPFQVPALSYWACLALCMVVVLFTEEMRVDLPERKSS